MSEEELIRRLETAKRIFSRAQESNRVKYVVADELHRAVEKVQKIVDTGIIDQAEQDQARALDEQLLRETEAFLNSRTSTLD